MNYLMQIRAFDDYRLYNQKLSAGQVSLWYTLMSINNKTRWSTWFTAANATLESLSGLSRSGIVKNRNVLKQLELIDFVSNGRKATSYHVCTLYTSDSVQGSTQISTQGSVQDGVQSSVQNSSALLKQNETKPNSNDEEEEELNLSKARTRVFDLWKNVWNEKPNAVIVGKLSEWIDTYGADLVYFALQVAGKSGVVRPAATKYLDTLFDDWKGHGATTVVAARKVVDDHNRVDRGEIEPIADVPDVPIFKLTD